MNSIKTLEDHLFEKVKMTARGSYTIVKDGAGFIPQGCYLISKEEVELMVRKKIALEIKGVEPKLKEIKIITRGSNITVKNGAGFIPQGGYITSKEEVESMVHNKICRDYLEL